MLRSFVKRKIFCITLTFINLNSVHDLDCSKFEDKSKSCVDLTERSKSCNQELFNSEKFAVQICNPSEKNDCIDRDKININIMMKSNNNVYQLSPEISEIKGSSFASSKSSLNRSCLFNDISLAISSVSDVFIVNVIYNVVLS